MADNNKHTDKIDLLTKFFAGEASIEEQIQLDKWKAENPENLEEFNAFGKLWNLSGNVANKKDINVDFEWSKLEGKILSQFNRVIVFRRVLQIAAIVVVISALAVFSIKQVQSVAEKSPIAASTSFNLPDGSAVELNAGSKIIYKKNFGTHHRNLTLKGEAYFEVKKDSSLPFLITANGAQIEVLGTAFNVKAYKDKAEVKVYVSEGTVTLYNKNEKSVKTLLTKGETGVYNRHSQSVKKMDVSTINDIAWRTMIIELEDTPLSVVEEILESTYHKEIEIADNILNCPVTATFENSDIQTVLKIIKASLDLNISSNGKKIYISGSGC